MFKKSMSGVLAALAGAVLVSACGGGGGGGGGGYTYDPGYGAWYDVFDNYCGSTPRPGCNFYSDGTKIIDVEDPYFRNYYALEYKTFNYTDSYGSPGTYIGWGWRAPNGIIYDYYGTALNDTSGAGRDFAGDVADAEQTAVKAAGEYFAAKYQLDAAVGIKVAQVLQDYATLGKEKARTKADYAAFSQRLYGQDVNEINAALAEAMKGNKGALDAMVKETATNWGTTPETLKTILKSFYGKNANQVL